MTELLSKLNDGVATITINRPEAMNAMPSRMWLGIADLLRSYENNSDVRCVVITGNGDHFCAGGDVKEFSKTLSLSPAQRADAWMKSADQGNALFLVMERMPQPVIVSVRGMAAGGGLALTAAADLAIASETSRFFVAQIKLGAIPDSAGSYNLLRNMGVKRAKQFCFLGDEFDAETAMNFDLVNWVVPDAELEAQTVKIAKRLAKVPSVALARTKNAINMAHRISIADHLYQESLDVGACVSQPDFEERVSGFINRKKA